jgi:hypothetical protein
MKAGSRMLLDVHPRLTRLGDGRKSSLIADPAISLLITEGVPKADAAISIDLCCIALLGVWNWRGTNEVGGKVALADWELIAMNGRTAYIVFDSDVMQKREVAAALARLKTFLESRAASVRLIYLPAGKHDEKVGLDDFIAMRQRDGCDNAQIRDELLKLATDELSRPPTPPPTRPEIMIRPGDHPATVDRAEQVLVSNARRLGIFRRGNEIVQVTSLGSAVQLYPVSSVSLQETLDRLIDWTRAADRVVRGRPIVLRRSCTPISRGAANGTYRHCVASSKRR